MSTNTVIYQRSRVTCDHVGPTPTYRCQTVHDAVGTHQQARWSAERAGWEVRPWRGKGSRSAGDYCPKHKTGASK